jgi:hypothetical protein
VLDNAGDGRNDKDNVTDKCNKDGYAYGFETAPVSVGDISSEEGDEIAPARGTVVFEKK